MTRLPFTSLLYLAPDRSEAYGLKIITLRDRVSSDPHYRLVLVHGKIIQTKTLFQFLSGALITT